MATHNRFFSFFSEFRGVVVAFAPFVQQGGEELFFFSEKLLFVLPSSLFFSGRPLLTKSHHLSDIQ